MVLPNMLLYRTVLIYSCIYIKLLTVIHPIMLSCNIYNLYYQRKDFYTSMNHKLKRSPQSSEKSNSSDKLDPAGTTNIPDSPLPLRKKHTTHKHRAATPNKPTTTKNPRAPRKPRAATPKASTTTKKSRALRKPRATTSHSPTTTKNPHAPRKPRTANKPNTTKNPRTPLKPRTTNKPITTKHPRAPRKPQSATANKPTTTKNSRAPRKSRAAKTSTSPKLVAIISNQHRSVSPPASTSINSPVDTDLPSPVASLVTDVISPANNPIHELEISPINLELAVPIVIEEVNTTSNPTPEPVASAIDIELCAPMASITAIEEVSSMSNPAPAELVSTELSASATFQVLEGADRAKKSSQTTRSEKDEQAAADYWSGPHLRGFTLVTLLSALILTLLLEALDQTIVGTALPKIIAQFQGLDRYTWVGTAYLLASITMIPITGKLSDQFGRKQFFISGVIIFLLGSLLSGAAQNMNQLIVFRAIQGLGAGMGISLVFAAAGELFPPSERARWQGIFSGVYGFANVVGPTLGGWLTDHGPLLGNLVTDTTRWRWIFYVNLPVGLLALLALFIFYPNNSNDTHKQKKYRGIAALRRIDFLGAILVATATVCLLLGLTWGSNQIYAWNSVEVIGILIASAVAYVLFIVCEYFAVEPILPLALFKNRVFAANGVIALMIGMVLLSLVYYLPLFLQGVLGTSASDSGLAIIPLTVCISIGAIIGGALISKTGRYQMICLVAAVILSIGVSLLSTLNSNTSFFTASIHMVIAGIGMGIIMPITTIVGQNTHPRHLVGVTSSTVNYLRSLGQTLGLAIVGTVVAHTVDDQLSSQLPATAKTRLPEQVLKLATDTQALINPDYRQTVIQTAVQQAGQQAANATQDLLGQVFETLRQALAVGVTHGFQTVIVFCAVIFVAALFMKDKPLARRAQEQQAPSESTTPAPEPECVAVH
jgi:EmrB/QacA subfamily drug resistance transporter